MGSGEREMNLVTMTIINPWKEYWPRWGSNQPPSVLKSATLSTELWGLAPFSGTKYIMHNYACSLTWSLLYYQFIHSTIGFNNQMSQKVSVYSFNSLPNDKIVEVTKLKAFADDKSNIAKMTISLFDRVENAMGKGEYAGYQNFLLFSQCFPKPSFSGR